MGDRRRYDPDVPYKTLGNTGLLVSHLFLGTMTFHGGEGFWKAVGTVDQNGADELVKAAKYRLAQSDEALLRLCRLCCSIKLHCQGMTVDEATRFFMDNCYWEEKPAHSEAVRGTFDPGYLYYTLGKLMIFKLRSDWQAQEGASYSLQKFHDEFLRHGMPPIPLLRKLMLKDPKKWPEAL